MANTKITTSVIADGAITSAKLASGVGGVAGIVSSADATAITITSSENVGIGETNSANLLHVKASDTGIAPHASAQIVLEREGTNYLQFLTAENGTSGLLFGDGSDVDVSKIYVDHNTTKMTFVNETAETMVLSGSNVGIGTSSPTVPLDIQSDSNASAIRIRGRSDDIAEVDFYNNANDSVMARFQVDTGYFATHVGGSERIRIDNSGRVGINRTPAISNSKLEVGGADNVPLINVEASGVTGGIGVGSSKVQIFHGTSAKLFLTSDGSLGINESVPTGKLHVRDNNFAGYMGTFSQGGSGGGNHGMYIETGASSSYLMIQRVSGTTMHYVVGNGNYYFAGSAQSDFNKKENILDISNGLDVVNNLRPRTFNFKDNSSVDKAGFIAQEAQIVEPRLVSGNEFDETQTDEEGSNPTGLGFDYMGYTAYLTKAIQEQQTLIESLTTRLETLENA